MSDERRETVCQFLDRVADFLEAHGRDEGGFSEETRKAFADDAARLRHLRNQRYAPATPASKVKPLFRKGDRVAVDVPDIPLHALGVVANNTRRPDRVNVRLDGLKTSNVYHVKFVTLSSSPLAPTQEGAT